jgi:hypothetical protein
MVSRTSDSTTQMENMDEILGSRECKGFFSVDQMTGGGPSERLKATVKGGKEQRECGED